MLTKAEKTIKNYQYEPTFRNKAKWAMKRRNFFRQVEGLAALESKGRLLEVNPTSSRDQPMQSRGRLEKVHIDLPQTEVSKDPIHESRCSSKLQAVESSPGCGHEAMLEGMYELAMDGLAIIRDIYRSMNSDLVEEPYGRLQAWGLGQFDGARSLTKMLAKYPESYIDLENGQCGMFHTAIINILLETSTLSLASRHRQKYLLKLIISSARTLVSLKSNASARQKHCLDQLINFLTADTMLKASIFRGLQLQRDAMQQEPNYLNRLNGYLDNFFKMLPVVESMRYLSWTDENEKK